MSKESMIPTQGSEENDDMVFGASGTETIKYECDLCNQTIEKGSDHSLDCPRNPENQERVVCKGCGNTIESLSDHKSSCPFSNQGYSYGKEQLITYGEAIIEKGRSSPDSSGLGIHHTDPNAHADSFTGFEEGAGENFNTGLTEHVVSTNVAQPETQHISEISDAEINNLVEEIAHEPAPLTTTAPEAQGEDVSPKPKTKVDLDDDLLDQIKIIE